MLTQQFNSQRAGIWVVALLFIVGGLLLATVDEKQGIRAGQEASAGTGQDDK